MSDGLILIVLAVIFVVVALLFTAYAVPRQRAAFAQKGVTVDAEVTNLNTRSVRGFILSSTGYYVGYTYLVDEVRQAGNYRISEYAYNQLKVGGKISITYLSDHSEVSKPAVDYLDSDVERNNSLSCLTYFGGIAGIFFILGIIALGQKPKPTTSSLQSAEQQSDLAEIHAALDPKFPAWRESASTRMARMSATDAGFGSSTEMREVYYGLCNTSHFYVYVIRTITTSSTPDTSWFAEAYTYLPGVANVADCLPEGWSILTDTPIGSDWHHVYLSYPAQLPFYKLTATAEATHAN